MLDPLSRTGHCPLLLRLAAVLAPGLWTSPAPAQTEQQSPTSPAIQSRRALDRGEVTQALELANEALRKNPHDRAARRVRASVHDALRRHAEAIEDYDALLRETSDSAELYHLRGRSRFKAGDVKGSLGDFDRAIELEPQRELRLWERGISLYYVEDYAEGARQFEAYQRYDASDVENVVWRYLCQARGEGALQARAAILPLDRKDPRVPMMAIYALYRGQATPEDVLAAARARNLGEDELRHRLFYAHLHIGLYFEAESNAEQARHHLRLAHNHKISHYMWDVANVHLAQRGWHDAADASSSSTADGP